MMDTEEKIAELVRRNLKITSCPVNTIREFKAYCDAESAGNYAAGLQVLLSTYRQYANLIPLISSLIQEVESVKGQGEPTKQRRTFA